jgi:hypothetical protein
MHRCLLFVGIFAGCAQDDAQVDTALQPLVVRCAHPDLAAGAWRCGEARTIECTHHEGGNEAAIYVDGGEACVDLDYQLSDPGPYLPGEHVIVVQRGDEAVCESVLTVVDTTPPHHHVAGRPALVAQPQVARPAPHRLRRHSGRLRPDGRGALHLGDQRRGR